MIRGTQIGLDANFTTKVLDDMTCRSLGRGRKQMDLTMTDGSVYQVVGGAQEIDEFVTIINLEPYVDLAFAYGIKVIQVR